MNPEHFSLECVFYGGKSLGLDCGSVMELGIQNTTEVQLVTSAFT